MSPAAAKASATDLQCSRDDLTLPLAGKPFLVGLLWKSEGTVAAPLLPWQQYRQVPAEAVEMKARGLRIPLLLLLVIVVVKARLSHIQRWGGFKEQATSEKNMNSTIHFFIQSYNNASNDTYLFQVQKLIQSQMQLTTGVEYLVTVKIGRTKCKKNETKKASCPLQSNKLKKSLVCKSLIYTVPWMNYYQLWNNSCQGSKDLY
ncbi:cystatin-like 1 isoform X2 [Cricetulus griseus]|uniref:Cystatin-like 1 isoform X2 n=2 Tax=Cricetulus griseus TaxID=10029 RepID=A0A9J7JZY5_CRIGR|nr:cystatin-like 1 isoform X2 [Cricetulus griseus]